MSDPDDIVTRLRKIWYSDDYGVSKDELCEQRNAEAKAAAAEINRLRAERDEARREVCNLANRKLLPCEYARFRAWDCYPKGKR